MSLLRVKASLLLFPKVLLFLRHLSTSEFD